jgi:hypothetical protein
MPETTNGAEAVRCVYLADGAALVGFTLTNGATRSVASLTSRRHHGKGGRGSHIPMMSRPTWQSAFPSRGRHEGGGRTHHFTYWLSGGGVCCESTNALVSNCRLVGNSAALFGGGAFHGTLNRCAISTNHSLSAGGGVYGGRLENCMLTGNLAGGGWGGKGGGVRNSTLNNCTLVGNMAVAAGGGADHSTLNNCIVWNNVAGMTDGSSNYHSSTLAWCCTMPPPTNGWGNITNPPLLVDLTVGNFHLQSNSPCINSGNNAFLAYNTDFDDNPRVKGGTVDIGACEFQSPRSVISYAWLRRWFLPNDGSVDFIDWDHDGMNTWQEWRAGTNPYIPVFVLKMLSVSSHDPGLTVTWQSVPGIYYFLERSSDLGAQPAFTTLATNLVGSTNTMGYTDTTAVGSGPFFYRVWVR